MKMPMTGRGRGGEKNGRVAVFTRLPIDLLHKVDDLAMAERRPRASALAVIVDRYFKSVDAVVVAASKPALKGKA